MKGTHERRGGNRHIGWTHQVNLWHRRHGSCAAIVPLEDRLTGNPRATSGVLAFMTTTPFSINWDYRCPFARNAHEHLVVALEAGAPFEASFVPFSLNQAHVEEGDTRAWEDPAREADLLAGQVGIVVRDRFPERFLRTHLALFALRHDHGGDLRDRAALDSVLGREGVDPGEVFDQIKSGWPLDEYRKSHEAAVADNAVFGVPTFVADGRAAFVRIMTRPGKDAGLATATIERVLDLLEHHVELNEFKHTTIPN